MHDFIHRAPIAQVDQALQIRARQELIQVPLRVLAPLVELELMPPVLVHLPVSLALPGHMQLQLAQMCALHVVLAPTKLLQDQQAVVRAQQGIIALYLAFRVTPHALLGLILRQALVPALHALLEPIKLSLEKVVVLLALQAPIALLLDCQLLWRAL